MHRVDANPRVPAHHPQQALIMQRIEQMRRRVGIPSPIIFHLPMREMSVNLLRVHDSAVAHEVEQLLRALSAAAGPRQITSDRHSTLCPRMHQDLQLARDESVIDEEIFFHAQRAFSQPRIAPLQIARAVALHALPQNQILRPGRRADRIRLNEFHAVQRPPQRGGRKQALSNGHAAQIIKRHEEMLPESPNLA